MLGQHLFELFRILLPFSGEKEVRIDGFRLLNDRNTVHPLLFQEDRIFSELKDSLDLYEPRIGYIQRVLESLLALVDLEYQGKKVNVDGFRLKNLQHWLAPVGGAADILAQSATRCNLRCRFCYNMGAPPALQPKPGTPDEEY